MTLSAVGCMICVLSELEGAQEGEEKHDGTSVESSSDFVQTLDENKSVLPPPKKNFFISVSIYLNSVFTLIFPSGITSAEFARQRVV